MSFSSWITKLFAKPKKSKSHKHIPLSLQSLEGRVTPALPFSTAFPTAVSIVTNTGSSGALASTSAAFTVAFSDAVTGVDASDFSTVATGNVAVGSLEVSGSGKTYTVTAKGVTGDGQLGLNLNSDASISANASFAPQATFGPGKIGTRSVALGDFNLDQQLDIVSLGASGPFVFMNTGNGTFSAPTTFAVEGSTLNLALGDVNNDSKVDIITTSYDGFNNGIVSVLLGSGNGTFATPATFACVDFPGFVKLGDVNSDGNLDIVNARLFNSQASVLLGNGNGTFGTQSTIDIGSSSEPFALGDVNGDKNLDIVTVDGFAGPGSVYLGKGDGTFGAKQTFEEGSGLSRVTLGDVNGDKNLDIVSSGMGFSGPGDLNVTVLLGNGNATFSPPATFKINSLAQSVSLGDVNGDSNLDIVTLGGDSASVLLGDGKGSFATQTTFAVGPGAYSGALGDVNGDGKLDIVSGNYGDNSIGILMGNGDGTFKNQTTFGVGIGNLRSVELGDVNGDGHLDIVTANTLSNSISVLLGNGNGSFATLTTFSAGNDPYSVALGDVNGDGKLDLVTGNNDFPNPYSSTLLGNGDGTFSNPFTSAMGGTGGLLGDVNGDGKLDLVSVYGQLAQYGKAIVQLGNGNGTFSSPATFGVGRTPKSVSLGDVNGDGKLDIVTSNQYGGGFSVLLGNGDGSFGPQTTFAVVSRPSSESLGDVNGDGKLDIVAVSGGFSNDTVNVLLGDGKGSFAAPTTFAVAGIPDSVTLGDVNGDGKLDIVTRQSVFLGNGDGTFGAQITFAEGGSIATLVDVNNDGRLDIVTGNFSNNTLGVLLGNNSSSSTVQFAPKALFAVGNVPENVTLGDVNSDGKLDIVTANFADDNISVLLGIGKGTFGSQTTIAVGDGPRSATLGDVNGDGKLDIVASNGFYNNDGVLLLGNGDGSFANKQTIFTGQNSNSVLLGDVNADGKLDIVMANGNSTTTVLLGNADGTFGNPQTFGTGGGSFSGKIGDVNGDGKQDIVIANFIGSTASVLLGKGDGTFATFQTFATGKDPTSVSLGDVNSDGKLDIITANSSSEDVSVLLGIGNGSFLPHLRFAATDVRSVALGDVNGDGNLDIVTGGNDGLGLGNACVLLGNGNGTFNVQQTFSSDNGSSSVALGDFNADGRLDIVTANNGNKTVSVLLNSIAFTGQTYTVTQLTKLAITSAAAGGTNGALFTNQPVITIQDAVGETVTTSAAPVTIAVTGGDNKASLFGTTTINAVNGKATFSGVGINGTVGQQYTLTFSSTGLNAATQTIAVFGSTNVVSITRSSGTTASTSAEFNVTFSESVLGVDPSDFVAIKTGTVNSGVITITGSGSNYTVTVSGITGNGSLGLNLVDNGSIRNLAGIPLYPANAKASFSPQATFGTGNFPFSVVQGDVNGDSKLDLVTGNFVSDNVSVLLGNGNGTFATQQAFTAGDSPYRVTLGDVNGDGKLDLVTSNFVSDNVSVLLGNGNGTFAAQQTFAVGDGPYSVTLADVNGDSILDLVTANTGSQNTSVLLGNGNGTFANQNTFATGANPASVTNGDVNGDGKLDLVIANLKSDNASVLLGNGNGTFATQQTFAVGTNPVSVSLGDVNGDGKFDLVTTNLKSYNISVLLGNGNGTFASQNTFAVGAFPRTGSMGDINGDGKIDIVVPNYANQNASILLGNGDGTFANQSTIAVGVNPAFLTLGDFNGDARLDIASANSLDNNVGILLNALNGNFTGQVYSIKAPGSPNVVSITRSSGTTASTSADFNVTFSESVLGVDPSDFVAIKTGTVNGGVITITGSGSNYTVTVSGISGNGSLGLNLVDNGSIRNLAGLPLYPANAKASFSPQATFGTGKFPFSVVQGDVNGDSKLDLVTGNFVSDNVSVLLGNGNGTFATQQAFTAGDSPYRVTLGDVNGDGKLDLVTANFVSDNASVLLGLGDGTFATQQTFAVGDGPYSVTLADVNGDSKLDLVTANTGSQNTSVLLGNGDGTFANQNTFAVGVGPTSVTNGDVNGDGKLDLVTANFVSDNASVLLGNGDGTFATQQTFAVGTNPVSVSLGDVNGDGKFDLVTTNLKSYNISVLLGNGNGTFASQNTFAVGAFPRPGSMGDINGDGKIDIVVPNYANQNASILLGNGDGSFATQSTIAVGINPAFLTLGDFNGDARLDIASANSLDNNVGILLNALNGNFTGQVYSIDNNAPPSITSGNSATFTVGQSGSFTVTAKGTPTPTFATSGALPSGITLSPTGTLSGTPTLGGTFNFDIIATNGVTPDATQGFTLTVDPASTSTVLTSSVNPSVYGESVTFTATVGAVSPGAGTPSGLVTFKSGNTFLGTVTLNASGVATLSNTVINTLGLSPITFTATYNGDASFLTSTSDPLAQVVNKANTTIVLASSVNPSVYGESVTFTATVGAVSPGAGTPSGLVTFKSGNTFLGTETLNASGVATLSNTVINTLGLSPITFTATYNGDASFLTSTSDPLAQVVNKANSTIVLTSSVNPSVFGQSVTFTATVGAVSPGAGTPSGLVTFKSGNTFLGTETLNASGVATLSNTVINTLGLSPITFTATYNGDASFLTSTSDPLAQVVNKANSTTTLASSVNPSVKGQSTTLTATVTTVALGAVPTTNFGNGPLVTFKNGSEILGTSSLTLDPSFTFGVASLSLTSLPVGNITITAEYPGNDTLNSSIGSINQSVSPFGTASKLDLTISAKNALKGKPFGVQPVVTIQDAFGNTVGDSNAPVSLSVSNGATEVGTSTVNAVNGIAKFTDVGLQGSAKNHTLTYSSGSLKSTSQSIQLEAPPPPGLAVGSKNESSQGSTVTIVDPATGQVTGTVVPFPNFKGEIRVAAGDLNNDGKTETIAAAGPGGGPAVNIIDSNGKTTAAFFAYDPAFTGGCFITVSDVNNDGFADIITGAGEGGGPHVKIFNGKDLSVMGSFFAYAEDFKGGVSVASADINADGILDVVTGAGPGGGPHVKIFDGKTNSLISQWFAYASDFTGGVFVAVGDIGNDGKFEVVTGAGVGGGPVVAVFNPFTGALQAQFFAYGESFTGGVRVGVSDGNSDGVADLVTGAGPGGGPHVKGFNFPALDLLFEFFSGPADDTGGVFVN